MTKKILVPENDFPASGRLVRGRLLRVGENPEKSILPSMTEPEQLTSLDVILRHRLQGIPVPYFNGVFSDTDTPDLQKMDFIELAQLREQTAEGIEAAKQDLHALNKAMEDLTKAVPTPEEVVKEKPVEVSPN